MNNDESDEFLEAALKRHMRAMPDDEAVERVLKRLSAPLPRQKLSLWRLPGVLLDWQFAPAWPRVAALASCAVLGFAIGLSGIGQTMAPPSTPYSFVGGAEFDGGGP